MDHFEQLVFEIAVPALRKIGYRYNEKLSESNIDYGFSKLLDVDFATGLTFQRHSHELHAVGYGFTMPLGRTAEVALHGQTIHMIPMPWRLGHLLWEYYGLRIYARPDHWWEPHDESELRLALADSIEMFTRYGLPWLEDRKSRAVVPLSRRQWDQFHEAVAVVASPKLIQLGFSAQEDPQQRWHPSRAKPSSYFIKHVPSSLRIYLVFHLLQFDQAEHDDWPGFTDFSQPPHPAAFDVLVFRKRSDNPYDQQFATHEKAAQVWLSRWLANPSDEKPGPLTDQVWTFASQKELVTHLESVVDQVTAMRRVLLE